MYPSKRPSEYVGITDELAAYIWDRCVWLAGVFPDPPPKKIALEGVVNT